MFMYLVSVDPMGRSFLAKSGMNETIVCLSTEALLPFVYYKFALLQLLVYFNKIVTIEWAEPCIGTWIREDCCLPYFFPFASPENAGQCCFSWLILSNFFEQHHSHTYYKFKNLPLSINILAWPQLQLGVYRTRAIITRSWFETALDYKPQYFLKNYLFLVHK